VLAGEQLDPGPTGAGSRFRLVVPSLGLRMSLTYEVMRCVPGHEVLLAATSGVLRSTDRIVVTGGEDRSMVSYEARYGCGACCRCSTPSCGRAAARLALPGRHRVRAGQAGPGGAEPGMGAAARRNRRRLPRHARPEYPLPWTRETDPAPHASPGTTWPRRPPRTHPKLAQAGRDSVAAARSSLRGGRDDRAAAA
jgi:hypothetical protein